VSKTKKFFVGSALASTLFLSCQAQQPVINSISINNPPTGAITNQGYFIKEVTNEKKVYLDGKHFLSVLTANGIFALRPHPGDDVDGWGSTLYLQPFINGPTVLGHTTSSVCTVVTNNEVPNVNITANGKVSRGASQTYGDWSTSLDFTFDSNNKKINGSGQYSITLPGLLSGVGDLNYYKLASNVLRDVPLLDGSTGSTGDMADLEFNGDAFSGGSSFTNRWSFATWGSSYPQNFNTNLVVNAIGNVNSVDTARQGYNAIAPAPKPSLKVSLQSQDFNTRIMIGLGYDYSKRQDFSADNVGVSAYINSSTFVKDYLFNVGIESSALPSDSYSQEVILTSTDSTLPAYEGVYHTSSLTNTFNRIGSIKRNGATFTGKFKVDTPEGFFQLKRE